MARNATSTGSAPGATVTPQMTAIVQERYGEAVDVMHIGRIPRPAVGEGDVLVRVMAAGVDRGAWHLSKGHPNVVRLATGLRAPRNRVVGSDVAGIVEAVGPGVTDLRPGDEVFGTASGTFAEYALARADRLAPKPARLTFAEAAAIPVSATTALQAVRDHGRVLPGQRVLVIGASGGVGSFTVQIAKAFGADVTGVCRTSKVDAVTALGADRIIDYTREGIADHGERYDVIIDIGGNTRIGALRRALTPRGTLVIVGGETEERWLGGLQRQFGASALSPFVRQRLVMFVASDNRADLLALTELVDAGRLSPLIDRTYPLAEVPAAIQRLGESKAVGKLVIEVATPEG